MPPTTFLPVYSAATARACSEHKTPVGAAVSVMKCVDGACRYGDHRHELEEGIAAVDHRRHEDSKELVDEEHDDHEKQDPPPSRDMPLPRIAGRVRRGVPAHVASHALSSAAKRATGGRPTRRAKRPISCSKGNVARAVRLPRLGWASRGREKAGATWTPPLAALAGPSFGLAASARSAWPDPPPEAPEDRAGVRTTKTARTDAPRPTRGS